VTATGPRVASHTLTIVATGSNAPDKVQGRKRHIADVLGLLRPC
jgi:hypothetical protein